MLDVANVSVRESALLVVDAQDSFKATTRWDRRNNRSFEENVGALVSAYRTAQLPIFYFLHTDDDPGFKRGDPFYKLMNFLDPRPSEPVIHKNTRNCFTSTDLQSMLLERRVRRLAITGIQMEQCCETTARVAADLGYAVDFVMDSTMTFPIPHASHPGEELSVAAIEERTTYVLQRRFARVVDTRTLIAELEGARCTPPPP